MPLSHQPAAANCALLVIDMQYDFMPGGQLAVADGDAVLPLVNRLGERFTQVIVTQDWHPAGHISFASSHPGRKPFESITLPYGPQTLWPDHCIQGSTGAQLHADLDLPHARLILRKGCNAQIDSYSAFLEADRTTTTGLAGYLRERGIDTLFVVGLALDFCVSWSAQDARKAGFNTYVIEDACRAIDMNGSLENAWQAMLASGVKRVRSEDVLTP
ncbi:nicotinamidase [Pseudomonas cichorii]|uniref:bifunctional nicotinamidase/pyrazinamidase n=1 Tax=Pseudomonas capsici TaxID=2810614 RepID=UPI00190FD82B|nr:bifunctional nicotinamidase/pyrazinamidase [Pseudomonas capsici]MBX8611302.1 bifunctional nicotinamidase/pyrazinamidase [Pseudomonas cichorii]MCV4282388.1 bifunctional nicotinamidase/pyrazinamidase [Pseudomonas capsici]GFM70869.1 nicotinamidase [Pseudomonas cichorii]